MKGFRKIRSYLFSRIEKETAPRSRAEAAFDREYYLAANEDVRQSGMDPWRHFAVYGWKEGRMPHPRFDVSWYLESNADVAIEGLNPLEHFVRYGWSEGRQPVKGFVCDQLAALAEKDDPDLFNPLDHLVSANGDYRDWSNRIREVASGDLDGAIRLCTIWKQKGGQEEATPRLKLGELLAGQGDFSAAAAEFEDALKLDPDSISPLVALAETALWEGDRNQFQAYLKRLENTDPDLFLNPAPSPRIACLIEFWRLNQGRFLAARVGFDQLTKSNPHSDLPFLGRGLTLLELGSREESFRDFWRSHQLNPTSKWPREEMSRLFPILFPGLPPKIVADRERPESVLAEINRQTGAPGVSTEWRRMQALSQLACGDVGGATATLAEELDHSERGRETRCLLAHALADIGEPGLAVAELEAALPNDPEDKYLKFRILELGERWRTKPVFLGELQPNHCFEIGDALFDAKCFHSAASCLAKCAEESHDESTRIKSLEKLARCHLRNGQFELAEKTAQRVLDSGSTGAEPHLILGSINRRFGHPAAAIEQFHAALSASPHQEAWVYRDLSAELDRSGNRVAAIEILKTGRDRYPDDSGLDQDHQRLERLHRLRCLSESMARPRTAGRPVEPTKQEEFVSQLRWFIDADWPVIGRDLAECRICMDEVIRRGENWPLHLAYGDLLVRCGNKFDALGFFEEAHRVAAAKGEHETVRVILLKIIAALEQMELYVRCLSYLEQYVHGLPPSDCLPQYRRLACYSAMLGKTDQARRYWQSILTR